MWQPTRLWFVVALAGLFVLPATVRAEDRLDKAMGELLLEYQQMVNSLAEQDGKGLEGLVQSADEMVRQATNVMEELSGRTGDRLEHLIQIRDQAEALRKAKGSAAVQAAFCNLSETFVDYALEAKVEGLYILECPETGTRWAQKGDAFRNPFTGKTGRAAGKLLQKPARSNQSPND